MTWKCHNTPSMSIALGCRFRLNASFQGQRSRSLLHRIARLGTMRIQFISSRFLEYTPVRWSYAVVLFGTLCIRHHGLGTHRLAAGLATMHCEHSKPEANHRRLCRFSAAFSTSSVFEYNLMRSTRLANCLGNVTLKSLITEPLSVVILRHTTAYTYTCCPGPQSGS